MSTRLIHGELRVLNGAQRSKLRGDEKQLTVGDASAFPEEAEVDDSALPVFDQKQLGSCTANAAAFLAAWLVWRWLSIVVVYARLFIYDITRIFEGTPLDQDSGAEPASVYRALTTIGVCDETYCPYSDDPQVWSQSPSQEAYKAASKHKAELWLQCDSVDAVKQSILDKFPVSFGITLYESFESDSVAQNGVVPLPDVAKEKPIGGHDMVVVGFKNSMQIPGASKPGVFKVRNSWGKSWGDGGYCYVSYEEWERGNAVENITLRREVV